MESLKTVAIIAVLLVVGYLAYVAITNNPQTAPQPGTAPGWQPQVNVQLPEPSPGGSPATSGVPMAGSPGNPTDRALSPPFSLPAGSLAPPFGPAKPADASAPGTLSVATAGHATPAPNPGTGTSQPDNVAADGPAAAAAAPGLQPGGVRKEFQAFIDTAYRKLEENKFDEVHQVLSAWYGDERLTAEETRQLNDLLDQVAGTVIYSRQHWLERPHRVRPGETLRQIAEAYNVPWQLLAKINGIRDPEHLQPGQELKVVRGPFEAVVHLEKHELTLLLHGRYAGRFPIGVGQDVAQLEGSYEVREKTVNPTYYGPAGVVDADSPDNPLGERWIGLGNRVGLHGTPDPRSIGVTQGPGIIRLSDRDVQDVFDILSIGSRVVIRR